MSRNLYKVRVETELMVMANSAKEAVEIAKKNAPNEIVSYGKGNATIVSRTNDIPEDWKGVIPYTNEGVSESKKCFELVVEDTRAGLEDDEINHIIKIQETKKDSVVDNSIKPETRPDPIPPKLDWHETKSGRPLPTLRFIK